MKAKRKHVKTKRSAPRKLTNKNAYLPFLLVLLVLSLIFLFWVQKPSEWQILGAAVEMR